MTEPRAMTPAARELLSKCARSETRAIVGGRDWSHALELQKLRMVRLVPVTKDIARIVVTEAGRAALAEGMK